MIFVDTGPLIARYLSRDQHHEAAVTGWRDVATSTHGCFTSDLVIGETLTLLGRRADYAFAAARGRSLLSSQHLTILQTDEPQRFEALRLFEKYAKQRVSFVDCVSFVLMKSRRVRRAFTFDRHFGTAGFEVWPR